MVGVGLLCDCKYDYKIDVHRFLSVKSECLAQSLLCIHVKTKTNKDKF